MKDNKEAPTKKGKGVIITAEVTEEDAKRIQQAFVEGRLEFLGISEITISPVEELDAAKKWSRSELLKKGKPCDEGAPPL